RQRLWRQPRRWPTQADTRANFAALPPGNGNAMQTRLVILEIEREAARGHGLDLGQNLRTERAGTAGEDTLAEPRHEGEEHEADRRSLQRLAYADRACASRRCVGRFDCIEIIGFVTARHGEIDHLSGAPCDGFERGAQAAAKRAIVSG